MVLDSIKTDRDTEKKASQGRQRQAEKKSESIENRLGRNTRFVYTVGKTALVTGLLASASMIEATNTECNTVTELADRMRHSTSKRLPEPDIPVVAARPEAVSLPGGSTSSQHLGELWPHLREAMEKHFEERNHPSASLRDGPKEAQAISRQKISQAAMEIHQKEQDKGKDLLSSNREKIETLRSLMDKLTEKKVRERSLLERASQIPAARTLLSESVSTCHDPCSDTPASVDCLKQCETDVSSNPSACLDISASEVLAKVEPVSGLPTPNQQVRLEYTLSVQNHCPQTIKDVTYHVEATGECPLSSAFIPAPDTGVSLQSLRADPSSLAPGDSAGVKVGQDTSLISRCETYGWGYRITSSSLPPELSVSLSASGTDSTTNVTVSSQEKTFVVLGDRSWVNEQCHQTCPPATDTPSIVFVHGFKPSPGRRADATGFDCENDYWKEALAFLRNRGIQDMRTVKFYSGDRNCQNGDETRYSSDLHHDVYRKPCTDYHPGSEGIQWEGTNDESIYRLSCLFAQYLHYNFGLSNKDVILVGHSMGGLLMRETLYQMQENAGKSPFPPTIGHVEKAITLNTPHNGTLEKPTDFSCSGCKQGDELAAGNMLIMELAKSGRNPQSAEGFTEWTTIGSQCDLAVQPAQSSVAMDASHAVVYAGPNFLDTCYDHAKARKDGKAEQDAQYYYCDTSDPHTNPCGSEYRSEKNPKWRKTDTGLRGLSLLYETVTDAYQRSGTSTNKSPRLWALGVVASAYWALLAR